MASVHALSLYYDWLIDNAVDSCVVCEMHEDRLLIKGTGAELVSAKHRDLSYGLYTTFTMLVDDAGIGHLFRRWHALREKPTCRLVTTPALKAGEMQDVPKAAAWLKARQLAGESLAGGPNAAQPSAYDPPPEHIVTRLSSSPPDRDLKPEIPAEGADGGFRLARVRRFLAGLILQVEQPNRACLQYAAPSMYAHAVVGQLGIDISADALWEEVLRLFRLRMRAAGHMPTPALPSLQQLLATPLPPRCLQTPASGHLAPRTPVGDVPLRCRLLSRRCRRGRCRPRSGRRCCSGCCHRRPDRRPHSCLRRPGSWRCSR